MAAMNELTVVEIKARLSALQEAEAAHAQRDFDGELAAAITQGHDVDALEAQHLEAERQARRHRVERTALESALPPAMAREGTAAIAPLMARHDELRLDAIKARDKITRAVATLENAIQNWAEVRNESQTIGQKAVSTAKAAGIQIQRPMTFASTQVSELYPRLMAKLNEAGVIMESVQAMGPRELID